MSFSHFQLSATIPSTLGTVGWSSILDLGISCPPGNAGIARPCNSHQFQSVGIAGPCNPGIPLPHDSPEINLATSKKKESFNWDWENGLVRHHLTAAIASTQGSQALPEKENIPPNQKMWTETAEQMGVKCIHKHHHSDETRLTNQSIGIANGKQHCTYKDPYAGGEQSGKHTKPDVLSSAALPPFPLHPPPALTCPAPLLPTPGPLASLRPMLGPLHPMPGPLHPMSGPLPPTPGPLPSLHPAPLLPTPRPLPPALTCPMPLLPAPGPLPSAPMPTLP